MSPLPRRHAVYFAPAADHPLWQAGCAWLGRDPREGQLCLPPARAHVHAPWRYGFHATLKAPLWLAHGVSESRWQQACLAVAARHRPFAMPPLQVAMLDGFLALRPASYVGTAAQALRHLAQDCEVALDGLRAPLSATELARRTKPHFSPRQRDQVARYGYAHVLDDWRFHMTLSDDLAGVPADEGEALAAAARQHFAAALAAPLTCDAICLFVEPAPGEPFVLVQRQALGTALAC